jgi:hypothetical protein
LVGEGDKPTQEPIQSFEQMKDWILLRERALKAELRLLVLGTILANQVFDRVSIPTEVTVSAIALIGGKLLLGMVARG